MPGLKRIALQTRLCPGASICGDRSRPFAGGVESSGRRRRLRGFSREHCRLTADLVIGTLPAVSAPCLNTTWSDVALDSLCVTGIVILSAASA